MLLNNIYLVIRLVKLLKTNQIAYRYASKLKWFPIIQCVVFIPSTIDRLYHMYSNNLSFELILLKTVTISSTGFLYSIIYGLNPKIRNMISKIICRCKAKNKEEDDDDNDDKIKPAELGESLVTRRSLTSETDLDNRSIPPTPEKSVRNQLNMSA